MAGVLKSLDKVEICLELEYAEDKISIEQKIGECISKYLNKLSKIMKVLDVEIENQDIISQIDINKPEMILDDKFLVLFTYFIKKILNIIKMIISSIQECGFFISVKGEFLLNNKTLKDDMCGYWYYNIEFSYKFLEPRFISKQYLVDKGQYIVSITLEKDLSLQEKHNVAVNPYIIEDSSVKVVLFKWYDLIFDALGINKYSSIIDMVEEFLLEELGLNEYKLFSLEIKSVEEVQDKVKKMLEEKLSKYNSKNVYLNKIITYIEDLVSVLPNEVFMIISENKLIIKVDDTTKIDALEKIISEMVR